MDGRTDVLQGPEDRAAGAAAARASRARAADPLESGARSPARVLFLNDTARNGGPGRTLYLLLKFMEPASVHRLVVVPRDGDVARLVREPGVAEAVLLEPGLVENPVEPWDRSIERADFAAPLAVRSARVVGNAGRVAAGMARLATLVRRERVEAIFCNGTTAAFAGGALAVVTGVPAVWHAFYPHVPPAVSRLHRYLARSDAVRSILCVSRAVARQFEHCSEKVHVVHDAVDTSELAPGRSLPVLRAELGWSSDDVVFGSHGRILRRKGYLEMIEAARLALGELSPLERRRCRFAVVGGTPEDFRDDHLAECRAKVAAAGLGGTFVFLGERPDVRPYVSDFDVSVVPSVYEDPLPRAVLESMALEKPVVAFDVGGIGEALEDGVCGTLSPAGDVPALAAALVRYFRDPELRRRHGRAARVRIERDFAALPHARLVQRLLLEAVRGR